MISTLQLARRRVARRVAEFNPGARAQRGRRAGGRRAAVQEKREANGWKTVGAGTVEGIREAKAVEGGRAGLVDTGLRGGGDLVGMWQSDMGASLGVGSGLCVEKS